MAPLPDYVAGTITLTNGSTAFTGTGTGWLAAGFREGDTILGIEDNPGVTYVVESVTDNDSGTLTQPWDGPTGTYTYRMRYLSDGQRVTAQARQLIEMLGNGNLQAVAGLPGTPNTFMMFTGAGSVVEVPRTDLVSGANYDVQVDTLAGRAAYDNRPEGFAVLVSDTGDGRAAIYSKLSDTDGDWSDPAYVTGPAVTLGVGSVTPVAFGNDPDVTLNPVAGGYAFDFELPENATFQSGTITTLNPGEDATFSLSPIAGGYALNLGVPRGPTGDINGVTPFWQGRITVDATAQAAREGLGALGVGDFGVGGALPPLADLGSAADEAGPQNSFQRFEGGATNTPPDWNVTSDTLIQLSPQGGNNSRRTQLALSTSEDRVAFRRKSFNQPWAEWREVWHNGNQPVVSLAEAQAGVVSSPRAWSPQRVAQAIASLAPAVPADVYRRSNILATVSQSGGLPTGGIIERGSNANGEYVRFADGTQICSKTIGSLSVSTTSSLGGFFRSDTFTTPYAASFSDGNTSVFGARLFPTASVYQIEFGNNNGSTSSASYRFWALASASSEQSGGFVLVAIGRWF